MNDSHLEEKLTQLDHLQSACNSCGLCSEACATFQSTGWEHESPRGRLQLAGRFLHGNIQLKSDSLSTFDRCLGCQACEPLCPQHVPYGQVRQLVQEIRRDLHLSSFSTMELSHYTQWLKLVHRISRPFWRNFGAKWITVPSLPYRSLGSFSKRCKQSKDHQPVLAICCVQDLFQHDAIKEAIDFIHRLGESIQVDCHQPCCGAIFERLVQGGESICFPEKQKKAVSLQRKASQAFLKWMKPHLYFLSRGCQAFVYKKKEQSSDFYTWIEQLLVEKGITLYFPHPRTIYYQGYCNWPKGERDSIWRLLQRIQNLTIRDIAHPQACCGGYCGEALLHPEHAKGIVEQKLNPLPSGATLVVTSPDCWGQFKSHSEGKQLNICYPLKILKEAQIVRASEG